MRDAHGSPSPPFVAVGPERPREGARSLALLVVLLLGLLVPAQPGAAQQPTTRGSLVGTVQDEDGSALAHVDIHLPGLGLQVRTGDEGRYGFSSIPAGTVLVRFERVGYQTAVREIAVAAGAETSLDVTLAVSPIFLEELVVTGTAGARDPLATPQSVDIVSSQDLQEVRSASVGEVLAAQVPGVASIGTGSQAGIPVVRGLSGTRVRFMQNSVGQEFYQYGVRHHPVTSLAEAERIEMVRGVSSLLYGSDALGGAINVITRDLPSAPPGRTHLGGQVETQHFTNNGEWAGLVDLHGSTGPVGVRAGFERRTADNLQTPEAGTFFDPDPRTGRFGDPKYAGELPFTNFDQWSGYGQAGVRGDFGTLEAFGSYWKSEQNFLLPSGGPAGSGANPPAGLGLNLENTQVMLKGHLLLDGTVLRPTLSFQRNVRQAAAPGTVIEEAAEFPVDLEKDVLTARVELGYGDGDGTVGAELTHTDGERLGPVELEPASTVWNVGVFALHDVELGTNTLSVGGRLDVRNQEADPNELTADPDLLEETYTVLSASAGLARPLAEGLTLAANVGTGFRAPTIFELFANGVHGGVAAFQRGNPELDPERSYSGDLALRLRTERWQGEVTTYVQRIRNYVFLRNTGESTGAGLPVLEADQTDATLSGADGQLEVSPREWLAVGGSFRIVRGTGDGLEDPDFGNPDGDLPLLPADEIGAHLELRAGSWAATRGNRLRLEVRRAFEKDSGGRIEPFSQFDQIPFGTASTEAYTLVRLDGRTVLDTRLAPVTVSVTVTNLLDETYRGFLDTYKGYALSPGRNVALRLSAPLSFNR
jgi:iron complex outermembrane receptor protein/hemoglobin/transferrin/lactoferrin receptor protein